MGLTLYADCYVHSRSSSALRISVSVPLRACALGRALCRHVTGGGLLHPLRNYSVVAKLREINHGYHWLQTIFNFLFVDGQFHFGLVISYYYFHAYLIRGPVHRM